MCSLDTCIQVFFDSLLVYLAERDPNDHIHTVHMLDNRPAIGQFIAEMFEARLRSVKSTGVDTATANVFKDYFNVADFCPNEQPVKRNPSGKPAVKRRRL